MDNIIESPFDELLRRDNQLRWFKTYRIEHFYPSDPARAEANQNLLVASVADAIKYVQTEGYGKLHAPEGTMQLHGDWLTVVPKSPVGKEGSFRTIIANLTALADNDGFVGDKFWVELRAEVESSYSPSVSWAEGYHFQFSSRNSTLIKSRVQYDPSLPWTPPTTHRIDDYYDHGDETYLAAVQAMFVCVEALRAK